MAHHVNASKECCGESEWSSFDAEFKSRLPLHQGETDELAFYHHESPHFDLMLPPKRATPLMVDRLSVISFQIEHGESFTQEFCRVVHYISDLSWDDFDFDC